MVGNEYLYFETELQVKLTPHTNPFYAWGVALSPKGVLYVMDADAQWHKVEEVDTIVIQSLYQRLKLLKTKGIWIRAKG